MRAVGIEAFGGPDALRALDVPRPRPGAGEILVRVVAAGVNPVDARIRAGLLDTGTPPAFPVVPGWDVAGTVEELGRGAGLFRKGDRVWACAPNAPGRWGSYAEYVAIPETSASLMPARLLFEEAAAVPLAALTAYQALDLRPDVRPPATALIHAAAGGVGHFAVQLARQAGARVIGTAGPAHQSFVLGLGATAGLDYTREDFRAQLRRIEPDGVDLVLDAVGGDTLAQSYEIVKTGGRLVSLVDEPDAEQASARGITAHALTVRPDGQQLQQLAQWFQEKKLAVHVAKIIPLSAAAEAHRLLETRHVQGKLVLAL